jgi:cytoskeleton protein RodZ
VSTTPISAPEASPDSRRPIAIYAVAAVIILCSGILIWNFRSPQSRDPQVAVANSTPQPPAPAEPATPARPAAPHVDLQASEMTWVSLAEPDGTRILSQLFQPGDTRSVDLPRGATLRVGNAAGLSVRFNGHPIGAIGPHGAVRDVRFKDGEYKIVPVQ